MSISLDIYFLIVSLENPVAVESSVWSEVAGCIWPHLIRVFQIGILFWPFKKMAPISASAAEDIILQRMRHVMWIGPLRRGGAVGDLELSGGVSLINKWMSAQLQALGLEIYNASLWSHKIMLLTW